MFCNDDITRTLLCRQLLMNKGAGAGGAKPPPRLFVYMSVDCKCFATTTLRGHCCVQSACHGHATRTSWRRTYLQTGGCICTATLVPRASSYKFSEAADGVTIRSRADVSMRSSRKYAGVFRSMFAPKITQVDRGSDVQLQQQRQNADVRICELSWRDIYLFDRSASRDRYDIRDVCAHLDIF